MVDVFHKFMHCREVEDKTFLKSQKYDVNEK